MLRHLCIPHEHLHAVLGGGGAGRDAVQLPPEVLDDGTLARQLQALPLALAAQLRQFAVPQFGALLRGVARDAHVVQLPRLGLSLLLLLHLHSLEALLPLPQLGLELTLPLLCPLPCLVALSCLTGSLLQRVLRLRRRMVLLLNAPGQPLLLAVQLLHRHALPPQGLAIRLPLLGEVHHLALQPSLLGAQLIQDAVGRVEISLQLSGSFDRGNALRLGGVRAGGGLLGQSLQTDNFCLALGGSFGVLLSLEGSQAVCLLQRVVSLPELFLQLVYLAAEVCPVGADGILLLHAQLELLLEMLNLLQALGAIAASCCVAIAAWPCLVSILHPVKLLTQVFCGSKLQRWRLSARQLRRRQGRAILPPGALTLPAVICQPRLRRVCGHLRPPALAAWRPLRRLCSHSLRRSALTPTRGRPLAARRCRAGRRGTHRRGSSGHAVP
mmetsp:Transcript_18743/g.49023  ORF Transcript_18743/g.49023 Transcript_18743/m.49023 type:complete len:440 (-) Transcript_18743:900-2219(-)